MSIQTSRVSVGRGSALPPGRNALDQARAAHAHRVARAALGNAIANLPAFGNGAGTQRAGDGPAAMISSEQLGAVLMALEAEAYALRRADSLANVADGVLSEASALLREAQALDLRLASPTGLSADELDALRAQRDAAQRSAARLTAGATYLDQPLFDGTVRLRVGGGSLNLPDLTTVTHQPRSAAALDEMRAGIGAFQKHTIAARLGVVESTLENAAATRALARGTDFARDLAEQAREQLLTRVAVPTVGALLVQSIDVRA